MEYQNWDLIVGLFKEMVRKMKGEKIQLQGAPLPKFFAGSVFNFCNPAINLSSVKN